MYKRPIPIQELQAEEGGGLIIHHGLIIAELGEREARQGIVQRGVEI